MGRYGSLDYPTLAKRGFLLGLGLFALGALGEIVGHVFFGSLPGPTGTILLDLEVIGVLLGLLSPFVFGILMPLTE